MRLVPRSLRSQITVSVTLLVTVVVALAGLVIVARIDHRDRTDVDRQLAARVDKVRQDADKLVGQGARTDRNSGTGQDYGGDDYGGLLAGSQSLVRIISGGHVVAERGETPAAPLPLPAADGYATVRTGGQTWRSLTRPLDTSSAEQLEVLQDIDPIEQRLADNTSLVAVVTFLAALVTGAGIWLITRVVLQPLQQLSAGARGIRADAAGARLPVVTRPREVADLSRALTAMLDQLHAGMESTRRFTADAGHELRNPLAGLGMTLETLQRNPDLPSVQRRRALDAMAVEHQRLTALLTGLQALARGDAQALPDRTPVDLAELLEQAVAQARRRHPGTSYQLDPAVGGDATVDGWPAGLRLALDNLLDNAALHGRPHGTVRARLTTRDDTARVTISDDGRGIPPDQRQTMKERFTRGPGTVAAGSGLGLALVDQQARLHGGAFHLAQAATGGLRAELAVPVTEATAPGPPPR